MIREIRKEEIKILGDFLYEAIFIPKGMKKPLKKIIEDESLQVYIKDFGLVNGDYCLVSICDNKIVGACWARIMDDYGHIDEETPSMAISLLEEYRNKGLGTSLLREFLKHFKRISLSVQKANYAYKMYLRCGFKIIGEREDDYIMLWEE